MGVKGLWSLLDPTGKPVTLESLEGKILAVDVSIWLHQLMHGMRDRQGEPVPNAHLVGLFTRVCKLLFYKIRPVFVFDGGVPELKKQTLAARRQVRTDATERSEEVTKKLLTGLMKRHAVNTVLSGPSTSSSSSSSQMTTSKQRKPDMFELPPVPQSSDHQDRTAEEIDRALDMRSSYLDIFAEEFQDPDDIDPDSDDFKALPAEIRYELLNELRETRKSRLGPTKQEMPEETEDFSKFQLARMMRKSKLTTKLVDVRKEINAQASGSMVQGLTGYEMDENVEARRLVSCDTSHYILIKGLNKQSQVETNAKLVAELKKDQKQDRDKMKTQEMESASQMIRCDEPKKESNELPAILLLDEMYSQDEDADIIITDEPSERNTSSTKNSKLKSKDKRTKPQVFTVDSDYESDSLSLSDRPQVTLIATQKMSESVPQNSDINNEGGFIRDESDSESNEEHPGASDKAEDAFRWESRDVTTARAEEQKSDDDKDSHKSEEKETEEAIVITSREEDTDAVMNHAESSKDENAPTEPPEENELLTQERNVIEQIAESSESLDHKGLESDSTILHDPQHDVDNPSPEETEQKTEEDEGTLENEDIHIIPVPENVPVVSEDEEEEDFIEIPTAAQEELRSAPPPETPQTDSLPPTEDDQFIPRAGTNQPSTVEDTPTILDARRIQELLRMDRDLVTEADRLQTQRGRLERQTATLSDQIMLEAQELLRLFGMPYIVSPQEAEAQCAELDLSGQTHGTITDDSDIWLFGGTKVYKNMFNQGKYVEFYNIHSIKSQLLLERESLIGLAYLCGSDYTPGVVGVGPVTALELLAEFPAPSGLERLRRLKSWWNQAQKSRQNPFSETKVKAKLRQLKLKPGFPSEAVWSAYIKPQVEQDREKFSWDKPDLDLLRLYALEKFGWSQAKADEALLPVMKRVKDLTFQRHITSFFSVDFEPKKPKSKRVKNVLDRMQGKEVTVPMTSVKEKPQRAPSKRLREDSTESENKINTAKVPKSDTGTSSIVKTVRGKGPRGKGGQRGKGGPRPSNGPQCSDSKDVLDSVEVERSPVNSGLQASSSKPQGRGRGTRGQGSRGRPKRGRGIVLAQKQRGGSLKILHCPNNKNVVEEVKLSESSSDDD